MIFNTKRFMYDVLKKNIVGKPGCNAIVGARKIGKTVLMLQLSEENDCSIYKDCSRFKETFSFKDFYEGCKSTGVRTIFLDEVCKLNDDLIGDFIEYTKIYAGILSIVITGSVSASVSKLCNSIGRGNVYELPPIMYIERLLWSNNVRSVSSDKVRELSTYTSFVEYLKVQNNESIKNHESYILSVVQDTMESYLRGTSIDDTMVDIKSEEIWDAVKYISFCQMVYKKDNGSYIDVPPIRKDLRDSLKEDYVACKTRWGLNADKIRYVISILLGSGLARNTYIFRGNNLTVETAKLEELNVSACVFEYPWLASICISDKLRDTSSMLDMWVENTILLRELYIYSYADKLRTLGDREIDTIYGIGDGDFYGLEVKNRSANNINSSYLDKEKELAESIGLKGIEITSTDDKQGYLRVDKVVASLELEYMNLLMNGSIRSSKTVSELVNKYFG